MLEELKNFGIGVRNEGALSSNRIQRKLKGIVKKCHPIHQLIEDLGKGRTERNDLVQWH